MRRFAHLIVAGLAVAAMATGLVPASGATQVRPRGGTFTGTEAYNTTPLPVSLTVGKKGRSITSFAGAGQVADGCTNHITAFQAPVGPMAISAKGRFNGIETSYPQEGVRVKVAGTFVSRVKARGHISVRIAHQKACDVTRSFTVSRESDAAPRNAP